MNADAPTLTETIVKTMVSHTITYFLVGVLAFFTLNYAKTVYSDPSVAASSRPTSDPMVMAGPLFQPIRGLLFGVVFYLLRESFFRRSRGWLILWVTLVVIGIIGQFTGGLGSIEGLVYSRVPVPYQLLLLPEVFIQTFLLSALLFYWINHPKKWLNWILGIVFFLVLFFPALGLIVTRPT
ncbi:MAG TPA: hypothetical protein VK206_06305 [Anaerolineales bacterium]|nr:hypothetical protein [Anaerolineales bacterium]